MDDEYPCELTCSKSSQVLNAYKGAVVVVRRSGQERKESSREGAIGPCPTSIHKRGVWPCTHARSGARAGAGPAWQGRATWHRHRRGTTLPHGWLGLNWVDPDDCYALIEAP